MKTLYVHNSKTDVRTVCEVKDSPLLWQEKGLSYTASGYGVKIPTSQMVKFNGKWRRVYCCIFSNVGSCYIGTLNGACGENLLVKDY
jgi:hypothetical protein